MSNKHIDLDIVYELQLVWVRRVLDATKYSVQIDNSRRSNERNNGSHWNLMVATLLKFY